MATYRVKKQYQHFPALVTLINGERAVNLLGVPVKKVVKATLDAPQRIEEVPGATQDEMAIIFKEGNPLIEKVEDDESAEESSLVKATPPREKAEDQREVAPGLEQKAKPK